jgi:adenylosuccinate lyase
VGIRRQLSLLDLLKADPDVLRAHASRELDGLFDLDYHFEHVDTIFSRVVRLT